MEPVITLFPPLLPVPETSSGKPCIVSPDTAFSRVDPGTYTLRFTTPLPDEDEFEVIRFSRAGCIAEAVVSDSSGILARQTHYGSYTDWNVILKRGCADPDGCSGNGKCHTLTITLSLREDAESTSPFQGEKLPCSLLYLRLPGSCFADLYVKTAADAPAPAFDVFCPVLLKEQQELSVEITVTEAREPFREVGRVSALPSVLAHFSDLPSEGGSPDPADAPLYEADDICTPRFKKSGMPVRVPVRDAQMWTPSDPALYRVTAKLYDENGQLLETVTQTAGLASVSRDGASVYLNGEKLFLKGLAYREPLKSEHRDAARELALFREAGVNYLRSLYYPFSNSFLDLCSANGILTEQSAPFFGVGQTLPAFQNAPAKRPLFVSQAAEMVLTGRSYPCVLLWSLGDDCVWGDSFRLSARAVRSLDPGRLFAFHLPMTIPEDDLKPDVWSVHYAPWNLPSDRCYDQFVIFHTPGTDDAPGYAVGEAEGLGLPVLHDAFALIPCHDLEDLDRDPGIHEFWGESILRFVREFESREGTLGGAVMAAVDEDGSFHPSLAGYRYGILDASGCPKPEYWHLKMAYGHAHTAAYGYGAEAASSPEGNGCGADAALSPEENGCGADAALSPEENGCGAEAVPSPGGKNCGVSASPSAEGNNSAPKALKVLEETDVLIIENDRIRAVVDRSTGLFAGIGIRGGEAVRMTEQAGNPQPEGCCEGTLSDTCPGDNESPMEPLICSGPFLNAGRYLLGDWHCSALSWETAGEGVQVIAEGFYGDEQKTGVRFKTSLFPDGMLDCRCTILSLGRPMPHRVKAGIGLDPGGLTEFGIKWLLPAAFDRFSWKRQALWPQYPPEHIGRPEGTAFKSTPEDFLSQKFHVQSAQLSSGDASGPSLCLSSSGDQHIRLSLSPEPALFHAFLKRRQQNADKCILSPGPGNEQAGHQDSCVGVTLSPVPENEAAFPQADVDLPSGEFMECRFGGEWYAVYDPAGGGELMSREAGAFCEIRFTGTGIALRGTTDRIRGLFDIELDGKTAASGISAHTPSVYFPSMSRGYEKRYHQLLFRIDGLPMGEHLCRLIVRGEKEPEAQDCFISLESAEVLRPDHPEMLMLHVNEDFNYPRLVYGNYMRPAVLKAAGDEASCRLYLLPGPARPCCTGIKEK